MPTAFLIGTGEALTLGVDCVVGDAIAVVVEGGGADASLGVDGVLTGTEGIASARAQAESTNPDFGRRTTHRLLTVGAHAA
jgi:hypothetical protein